MPTLSICMIVRDEEETLARCLNCVKALADEIIVVDTGSVDKTLEIAGKFTKKIYRFKWNDDFSAARNYAFSKATGEFIMWLDADDVITDENADLIKALLIGGDFDVAFLKYACSFDDSGKPAFVYERERILRRSLDFKWCGAVHEVITPKGKIVHSPACIYHKKTKPNAPMRNLLIYQGAIARGVKLSPREKFYYGRELYFNNMLEECVAVLKSYLAGEGWEENKVEASRTLYKALVRLGKVEEALNCLVGGFLFSFPHAEDCCILAEYFERVHNLKSAVYWYERALSSPEKVEDGGFINQDYCGYIPAIRLCVLYYALGDLKNSERYNEIAGSYNPNGKSYLYNKKYFQSKGVERK